MVSIYLGLGCWMGLEWNSLKHLQPSRFNDKHFDSCHSNPIQYEMNDIWILHTIAIYLQCLKEVCTRLKLSHEAKDEVIYEYM